MSLTDALERLQKTEGFYVKQNWEALEQISSCYEQANTYEVFNIPHAEYRKKGMEGDVKILRAVEKTGFCSRMCCGENRGFNFAFETTQSKESLVRISRKYRCCGWAVLPCCAHRVDVHSAVQSGGEKGVEVVGDKSHLNLAAQVQVPLCTGGCCYPTFYLNDENKKRIGYIQGSSCWCCPCVICDSCGAEFGIYKGGHRVGEMKKLGIKSCKDCLIELHTEADRYTVTFTKAALEKELDVNFKLAVLAAVIQIDFNFFEDKRGVKQCHYCDLACCGYALPCFPLFCLALCCCRDTEKDDDKRKEAGMHVAEGAPEAKVEDI